MTDEPSSQRPSQVRALPHEDEASLAACMSAYRQESARRRPEFAQAYDALVDRLGRVDWSAAGPQVGERLPEFNLPDANGRIVSLSSLLQTGPVVVSLNRGHWCPYCRYDLRALAAVSDSIKALGGQIVSIMPDVAAFTGCYADQNALPFPLLTDMDNGYALSLGLVYWAGADLQRLYEEAGIALHNYQRNASYLLPVPAKLVLRQDGTIAARYIDVDFRTRTEPEEIVEALRILLTFSRP